MTCCSVFDLAMAATRLSDGQKEEIVRRYRAGETSTELAQAFACSANTVSRVVKAALDPADYERLKQQRGKGARSAPPPAPEPVADFVPTEPNGADEASDQEPDQEPDPEDEECGVLAIDDADDFGDDSADDDDGDDGDEVDADADAEVDEAQFVAVPVLAADQAQQPVQCRPFADATLPESVYMLVDKTVELQARPLREFTELGHLPVDEEERQALMVFVNPRQAKRLCGRSQRVIKIPDTRVLERTAPYLLAQGISRVVIEGSLYALPGA
ncbi:MULTISPECIES: helix-turn-helix domain-containing protein [Aphanothece]|uniref:helix-turn-helix domain-containing protein n=1 Tax=Aphanothece TaxID=1121 RepID=UPI00398E39C0